jgi:tetratricopeptide (TPR) repeat protein
LYFGGTLFPVLGFLEIYFFRFSFVADHWQYLASIGLITLFVCGGGGVLRSVLDARGFRAETALRVGGLILLAVLAPLTWQQSHAYASSERLWRDSLLKNPSSPMVHYNLALELEAQARSPEAKEHYRQAIELNPNEPNAYNNLALMLIEEGGQRAALELLREAVRVAPELARARWNLAEHLVRLQRFHEAAAHFEYALSLQLRWDENPGTLARSHVRYGALLARHDRAEEARGQLEAALVLAPDLVPAHMQLALLAVEEGDREEAVTHLQAVLRAEPGHRRAAELLARTRREVGRR